MSDGIYRHFLGKARDAQAGGYAAWSAMSTGEQAAVALVLNRHDWVNRMGFTMVQAIERAGPEWMAFADQVERQLREDMTAEGAPRRRVKLWPHVWAAVGLGALGGDAQTYAESD